MSDKEKHDKAKDEVLDELSNAYDGSEWLAAVEAVERMHYRWKRANRHE